MRRGPVPTGNGVVGAGTSEQVERCPIERIPDMRISTAYFAGAGTVIAAIVGGVGGGLLIADMIAPKSPKGAEMSRLEQRMSPDPIRVAATPSQPAPNSAPSQPPAAIAAAATVPAPPESANSSLGNPPATSANSAPNPAQPKEAAVTPVTASVAPVAVSPAQPAAREPSREPLNREPSVAVQTSTSEDATARPRNEARDTDVKRVDKRRAERRQQWADRRRYQQRQERELQGVEETVREETEPRRGYAVEPVRVEGPRIRLFGEE
jgi:hypothetical protein